MVFLLWEIPEFKNTLRVSQTIEARFHSLFLGDKYWSIKITKVARIRQEIK